MTEGYDSFLSTTKVDASVQAEIQKAPIENDDIFNAVSARKGKKKGRIKTPVQEPPHPKTDDKKKKRKKIRSVYNWSVFSVFLIFKFRVF